MSRRLSKPRTKTSAEVSTRGCLVPKQTTDATFLLPIGRFMLTIELLYLQLCLGWDPARPFQESPGPFGGEIPKESPKESPGPPAQASKKCPKESQESLRSPKTSSIETLETLLRLIRTLFGPLGRKVPGDSFGDFLGISGPKGPGDSWKGRAGSQCLRAFDRPIGAFFVLMVGAVFLTIEVFCLVRGKAHRST